jgi:hypothetical protein
MAVGKKITDLTASGSLKDTDLAIIHDGNGTKRSTLTQLSEYMGAKFSNPNLLINPDFRINQRGATSYTSNEYAVDRWKINNGTVSPQSNGVTVTLNNKGQFIQTFENTLSGTYTATIKVTSITGECALYVGQHSFQLNKAGTFTITENGSINGISLYKSNDGTCTINIEYIKLEQGSIATPFVAPNPAEELVKCRRYYIPIWAHFYGASNPNGFISEDLIQFRNFRTEPTINFKVSYSSGVTESTLTLKGSNINGYYLYVRTRTSSDYALDVKVIADAEIY